MYRTAFSDGLWRRAKNAGAYTVGERRNFGISDDIYSAGLMMATLIFVALSEPGSVDGPTLQRLIEITFRLDFDAIRYCSCHTFADQCCRFSRNIG